MQKSRHIKQIDNQQYCNSEKPNLLKKTVSRLPTLHPAFKNLQNVNQLSQVKQKSRFDLKLETSRSTQTSLDVVDQKLQIESCRNKPDNTKIDLKQWRRT